MKWLTADLLDGACLLLIIANHSPQGIVESILAEQLMQMVIKLLCFNILQNPCDHETHRPAFQSLIERT